MSWAAIVSGTARNTSPPSTSTTATATATTTTTTTTTAATITPTATIHHPTLAKNPPTLDVPTPSTIVSSQSPSISTPRSSHISTSKSATPPTASSPPSSRSSPSLSLSSSRSPPPTAQNPRPQQIRHTNVRSNQHHRAPNKPKKQNGKLHNQPHNHHQHNNYNRNNAKYNNNYNQNISQSPNQSSRSLNNNRPPSASSIASPDAANTNDVPSMWSDPRILSIYRLWTQHISFFMAQPSHFFAIFVTNPMFRQSVFEAGLTFHPDTDPTHPVLLNLNCSRFGMAERISALSPPAGIDLTGTNPPISAVPPVHPVTALPMSAPQTVPLLSSDSTHPPLLPLQTIATPIYFTPTVPPYYDAPSPMPTPDYAAIPMVPYPAPPILPESMDVYAMSENSPAVDDMLVPHFSDVKVEGSDTESERLSDEYKHSDYKLAKGFHMTNATTAPYLQNAMVTGIQNAHRTEPMRDGRRKVVSRVLDICIPPSPICKQQSDKAKVELIEQIEEIFPKITPPPDYHTIRDQLLSRLRAIISIEWPGADIHVYGSAGNGLGLECADVDMSLYMPNDVGIAHGREKGNADPPKVTLARLAVIMQQNGVTILGKFLDARVPVIKMHDPVSNLQVDVCVNNMLAVRNTELLKAYVDLDERFRYVCILVKLWAKSRDLNDAYHGTLSSYAYTLLVIHYLQTLDTCVLPCLQGTVGGKVVGEEKATLPCEMTDNCGSKLYNTYFDREVNAKTFDSKNTDPVHELLLGFFHYYAYVFQYRTDLASIRLGVRTERSERGWDEQTVYEEWEAKNAHYKAALEAARAAFEARRKADDEEQRLRAQATVNGNGDVAKSAGEAMSLSSEAGMGGDSKTKRERIQFPRRPRLASKHLFCIEDPFDIDHDLSRGMEKAAVTVIRQEMMRAYEIIAETGDFEAACEEYG